MLFSRSTSQVYDAHEQIEDDPEDLHDDATNVIPASSGPDEVR
jgi:hypothetical protein